MKLNIIVIDDSSMQLLITSKLIRQSKCLKLIGAYTNPVLGLSAINSLDVDIVLLDVEMPEMDGFSLKKLIKKKVDVIINSSKPKFEFEAYAMGAIDFISKPFNASRLDRTIAKLMQEEKYGRVSEKVFAAIAS